MREPTLLQRIARVCHGGFILAFHEIGPERFADLIDCVSPFEAIHLAELVQRAKRKKSTSGLFAITVDDGVGQNVTALAKAAQDKSLPITFYIPTGYVDSGEGMPFQRWRNIEPLLSQEAIPLCPSVADLSRVMRSMWHTRRRPCYVPMTLELEEYLARKLGIAKSALVTPPPITWPEVERLSKSDLIRFESHGISHTALSALTEEEIEFEMRHSRELISEHTSRECRHFAYPFGSLESIGPKAVAVARRCYDSATTMTLGSVDGADPWLLPRIPFYPENSRIKAKLKVLIKCAHFSPLSPAP